MKRLILVTAASGVLLLPVLAAPGVASATPAALSSASLANDKPVKTKKPDPANANKAKKPKGNPAARKGNPPAHSNGRGRQAAPGQVKKGAAAPRTGNAAGSDDASTKSRNENKKITFCHVPPGNPANGHLITTSVNAIRPGHVNHPGDIIPPFSFVRHGRTVSFPGQNWDAEGRAALENGCKTPAPGVGTTPDTPAADGDADLAEGQVKGASLSRGADRDEDVRGLDALLPDTGGARIAVLIAGLGLLAAGVAVLLRRRAA